MLPKVAMLRFPIPPKGKARTWSAAIKMQKLPTQGQEE
jgi:hypothetical protein